LILISARGGTAAPLSTRLVALAVTTLLLLMAGITAVLVHGAAGALFVTVATAAATATTAASAGIAFAPFILSLSGGGFPSRILILAAAVMLPFRAG
jgi:hypothetical protein